MREVSNLEARRQDKHSNFDARFCCSFILRRLKSVAFVANFHSDVATLRLFIIFTLTICTFKLISITDCTFQQPLDQIRAEIERRRQDYHSVSFEQTKKQTKE
jgi:hypothetical protein